MVKKAIVTGALGQLATEYQLTSPLEGWDFYFLSKKDMDITDKKNCQMLVKELEPDCIINLAAYTDVEASEKTDLDKAISVNAEGPKILAKICAESNIPLIHISTDYVFDGESENPYTERDLENPINQYGRTKFLGEKWIQENHDWYYIIRTSWVYSNHSKNFFNTMLKLAQERTSLNVIDDQWGSPTSTLELCKAIDAVLSNLEREKSGIYHFSGSGRTTWKAFAAEIFYQAKIGIKVQGISSDSWPSKVKRPRDSYMSSAKFANSFGYLPQHWKNALREIVATRKIVPIKVGDRVISDDVQHIIVSTDWLKRTAMISPVDDMKKSKEVSFDTLSIQ